MGVLTDKLDGFAVDPYFGKLQKNAHPYHKAPK